MAKKGGLGKGLDALFDDNTNDEVQSKITVRLNEIEPNKSQPRTDFDEEAIANLADSIKEHGLLQPLLVRPLEVGGYQIVAGERRWRACRMLGMSEVPVIIRDLSDKETMQIALVENLLRENLNPIEEAMGYKDLMDNYDMTQEEVAKTVGKPRSSIANSLRMLNLPDEIREYLKEGDITAGHAKALAAISNEEDMIAAAKKAAAGLLTVRDIEKLAQKKEKKRKETDVFKDSYYKEMELSLNEHLGRKVKIDYSKNKGTLQLEFYDEDDLKSIISRMIQE